MPTLITRGVSSAFAFGLTTATGGRFGWMAMLTPPGGLPVQTYAMRINSAGSYVVALNWGSFSYGSEYLLTLDSTGTTLTSQTVFEYSAGNLYRNVYDISLDASNNIQSVGRRYQITYVCCGPCYNYAYWESITKTNAASADLGVAYFGTGGASAGYYQDISKFSDDTILISGTNSSPNRPTMLKMNSAGSGVLWGQQNQDVTNTSVRSTIDGSDNVIALWVKSSQLGIDKLTSAGSFTFKKYLNGFSAYYWGSFGAGSVSKPTLDSSSNIYFTGHYFYQQAVGCCCFVYLPRSMAVSVDSTASTLRFAKGYVGSTTIQTPTTPVKDSSDNMYFANQYNGTAGNGTIIFKINSSGVLQWARALVSSASPTIITVGTTVMAIDGTNFVLSLAGNSGNRGYVLKMPTDGSGSGTTFALGAYSFTYTTPTDFSVVDLTLTVATDTNSSWSSYTPSVTASTQPLPAATTGFSITNKKI